ncbi:DEAD/DEAH box helicase [Agrobacterium rosae]|uniref:DEAD/DEAH box helicase n=1 Tax=Agrobacterium rosae TaxID=1972867 RepID=UPI003B9E5B22
MQRPYLQKTIVELRTLFEQFKNDRAELNLLAFELSKRSVQKAKVLGREVEDVLRSSSDLTPIEKESPRPVVRVGPASRPALPSQIEGGQIQDESPIELKGLHPVTPSGRKDDPASILSAWTALEALSPQSYKRPEDLASGERSRVVPLAGADLPWKRGLKAKPKHRLFFQIVLGCVALDRATDLLVEAFGEDEERSRPDGRKAVIAAILVDKDGYLLDENAVAISSFAWALRPALERNLGHLGNWPKVQAVVLEKLDKIVRRKDGDGNPVPIDAASIDSAYTWLVRQFAIPDELLEAPTFTLKVFHHFKARTPPEPSLLNSFFLDDIGLASQLIASGQQGDGLGKYLGILKVSHPIDVLVPPSTVEPHIAPLKTPQARWPSSGHHPLVLLQQAAVNVARDELVDKTGIIGVNGPPGTGKTTLLRDIVVGCVLDRASAMVRFEKPVDAFSTTGQKMGVGGNAFFHFYRLDQSLRGHEIVIASSNNKAVQNVSEELPLLKNNGRADEISYLRSISDIVANPRRFGVEDDEDIDRLQMRTWGLIAAVLGNGANRSTFQQTFWWHEDGGYRIYLKAAKGDDVLREIKDENGKLIRREIPSVVTNESPPVNEAAALSNWKKARNRFLTLRKQINSEIAALEVVRKSCVELPSLKKAVAAAQIKLGPMVMGVEQVSARENEASAGLSAAQSVFERARNEVLAHDLRRPGFVARLFGTSSWRAWQARKAAINSESEKAWSRQTDAAALHDATKTELIRLKLEIERAEADLQALRSDAATHQGTIETARATLGARLIDDRFFAQNHEAINLTAPWLPDSLHRKREDLFAAALNVQKAFVDSSAQKVLHNLNILMSAFTAGALRNPSHKALLGDLWSTLFMVVPAVSTTFASVNTMFGDLGSETIGWLLVDEAGQAVPQAAVGAIMRAKRSIVVGDPLQIPPVVSLPEKLNLEICEFFAIDQDRWSAPTASVQTLTDRGSPFQSTFNGEFEPRRVGFPLLVHRRCQDPMFSVSNAIAYDGQMVHAVSDPNPGEVGQDFGPSCWFDIDADADTKWSPGEGDVVVRMMRRIAMLGIVSPDLFIISPFKIVETEMRRRLERESDIFKAIGEDVATWVRDRVGTIHTFQGREAETVILLLGAPKPAQHRARVWAGNPPNIVNVAISRAKQNLYVVGSQNAWAGAGQSFQTLIRSMPVRKI